MISLFFFYFIVLKYILLILPPKYTLLHHLQCLLSSGHNHPLPWKKHLIYSPVSFFSSLFYSVSAMKGIFVNATVYYTLPQPSFITPSILPTSGPLCVFFFFFFTSGPLYVLFPLPGISWLFTSLLSGFIQVPFQ